MADLGSPALSPQLKRNWSSSSTPVNTPSRHTEFDDGGLFECPAELICPITQTLFVEPVLTASGHVYERAAIEQFLAHNQSDPLTRQPLPNKSLTPVYVLKSRAQEYRESAAKQCVDRACSRVCPEPVRYLRRAVELVAEAGGKDLGVRGLSQETVDYVVSHPSNAYDRLALQVFAQGLFQAGYRDRAASVYYHLLISGSDRAQQAQLLRRCLSCWSPAGALPDSSSSSSGAACGGAAAAGPRLSLSVEIPAGSGSGPEGGGSANSGALAAAGHSGLAGAGSGGAAAYHPAAAPDPHVFEKLVLLFEGQAAVGWGQIIDMAGEAGLGEEFVVRLCEQLLFRPMPGQPSASASSGDLVAAAAAARPEQQAWAQEKEILLKYVRVLCQGAKERCAEAGRRLQELEQWQQGREGSGGAGGGGGSSASLASRGGAGGAARRRRGPAGRFARPAWLGHPAVVAGCLLVAVLGDPYSAPGRLAGAVPILALLPAHQ